MANPQHVRIIKQGVEAWNEYKAGNPSIKPDLKWANLAMTDLAGADLRGADLRGAYLLRAGLEGANLEGAFLSGAHLTLASLAGANLQQACLEGADLRGANLYDADLEGANLSQATVGYTILAATDLRNVTGLETIRHFAPSAIGIDTIYKSKARIPESFLRGAGVPEDFIVYARSLAANPIEFYSCFISYSTRDQDIAERLHADLLEKGVRCWFAPQDLKIGEKFRTRIDESIRLYDKLMVLLSENSIRSAWVEEEVEAALEREIKQRKLVLFPIRLDDAVMEADQAWAASLRRTRQIGDFRQWKDRNRYQESFDRLLRDLEAKKPAASEG